jgi:hypothetical protein
VFPWSARRHEGRGVAGRGVNGEAGVAGREAEWRGWIARGREGGRGENLALISVDASSSSFSFFLSLESIIRCRDWCSTFKTPIVYP